MKILTMIPSMSANSNPYLHKVLKELKENTDLKDLPPQELNK